MADKLVYELQDIKEDRNTNLLPENLKKGVTCLGITGVLEEVNNQDKDITANGTYTADEGYSGLGTVNVNVESSGAKFIAPDGLSFRYSAFTSIDLSSFDTSNVTNMSDMFNYCSGLTSLDLSSFDTSNVTTMSQMFQGCKSLTSLDLSSFDTSNVIDMSSMFSDCSSLTSLDLSNFNTSKVMYIYEMFSNCTSLTELDLSSFDFTNVRSYDDMFTNVPADCLIYVKDETAKAWIEEKFATLTNVQVKETV